MPLSSFPRWLCCLAPLVLVCAARGARAQLVPTHPDLVYATVGGNALRLDLYLPSAGKAPYPLLVWIHGGGWSSGSKASVVGSAGALLQAGVAVASLDYRLSSQAGQFGAESVVFPAQIHDVKGAVRWLRAHAALYNLDPQRFASWGSSAGGHLSALLALTSDPPQLEGRVGGNLAWSSGVRAFADFFGPSDLLHMNDDISTPPGSVLDHDAFSSPESKLVGWGSTPNQGIGDIKANLGNPAPPYPQLVQKVAEASPLHWASAGDPPGFLAHGLDDTTVPSAQSAKLAAALQAAGASVVYLPVAGAGHGALGPQAELDARAFLLAALLPQESVYLPALSSFAPAPLLGSHWSCSLASAQPGAAWRIEAGQPAGAPLALPALGTLWLDLAQPIAPLFAGVLAPTASVAQVAAVIPSDPALHGAALFLQAICIGGTGAPTALELSNLLSVRLQ